MGCYYTLYINTYGYSLLFYKVYHEEGECQQLEFWLEKEQALETYSALLQKSTPQNLFLELIRIIEWKKHLTGPTPGPGGWGRAHPYWARPLSPGPPGAPPVSIFRGFYPGKNRGQAYGTKLHRHEAEPWRNQSRAPAGLFCRGHFPPGGGNHHHRHHQRSSHRERVNLHQYLHQHHLLSKP